MTTIRFYGRPGAAIGRQTELALPEGRCSVKTLRQLLAARHPELAAELLSPTLRACVTDTIVGEGHVVREADEVEFFPPLSGG